MTTEKVGGMTNRPYTKSTCYQAWWSDFNPWDLHGKRAPTPESFSLTSTLVLCHMDTATHTNIYNNNKCFLKNSLETSLKYMRPWLKTYLHLELVSAYVHKAVHRLFVLFVALSVSTNATLFSSSKPYIVGQTCPAWSLNCLAILGSLLFSMHFGISKFSRKSSWEHEWIYSLALWFNF